MKDIKQKISILILIIVVSLIIWATGKMIYLKYHGETTNGYIQSVYKAGSKGKYHCRFTYYVDNKKYTNTESYGKVDVGEKVVIKYAKKYPQISTLEKKIIDYY
jgi:hypothetical protein